MDLPYSGMLVVLKNTYSLGSEDEKMTYLRHFLFLFINLFLK